MAASFYASPLIGATTTLACFAHEIPHEIADYSILIRSGFSKKQAMQSQFLTAIGAFVCLLNFRCKLCPLTFFFQVGYVKSASKIINISLYSCVPTIQHFYRNCRPQCNCHDHWESGIWPCGRCTPRCNWLAWHHATNFRPCKSFSSFGCSTRIHDITCFFVPRSFPLLLEASFISAL